MKYVLEVLFPYFFLLYVCDCITFVKTRHVLLTSLYGQKFVLKRSGVRLAGLLPSSQTIISHNLPIVYTAVGIHAVFEDSASAGGIDRVEDFTFIRFEDLVSIEVEGKNIEFTGTATIKTPSSSCARLHAKFIDKIKKSDPADRQERIKAFLSDAYDLEAIKKISTANSKWFAIVKILSAYLFALIFIVLPAVLFTPLTQYINLNAFVIFLFLTYLLLMLVSYLTLKKILTSENDPRSHILLSIIFAPVNACHVLGYLTKDLYFKFDHLAIAACFLPRNSFKELVRKELFLIDYLKDEKSEQGWSKFWEFKKKLLLDLLDECQIASLDVLVPPEKRDQTAIYFCPFCMTEYRQKRHHCLDCDMALKKYDTETTGNSSDPSLS